MPNREQTFNKPQYKNRRSVLRQQATAPEQRFWQAVRGKQLGVKFRRQHGIGHYIVDFYCPELKLVVELDGDSHFSDEAQQYDAVRDDYIQALGIRVLRFTNTDVMQNLEGVLQMVMQSYRPIERDSTPASPGKSNPTPALPFPGEGENIQL